MADQSESFNSVPEWGCSASIRLVSRMAQLRLSGRISWPFKMATNGVSRSGLVQGIRWMRTTPGPSGSSVTCRTRLRCPRKNARSR